MKYLRLFACFWLGHDDEALDHGTYWCRRCGQYQELLSVHPLMWSKWTWRKRRG